MKAAVRPSEAGTGWRLRPPPPEATITLGLDERSAIASATGELAARLQGRDLDDHYLLTEAAVAARLMPAHLVARLTSFRVAGNAFGMLLIRNLPVGPLLPTPGDGYLPSWQAIPHSTLTQLGLMSLVGDVISYADEKRGHLVQDICPVPGEEQRQENTGSTLLELHTEDGFHPFKPEFISLMCLRPDHERVATTVTASVRSALPLLSEPTIRTLREPGYRIRFSSSFVGIGGPPAYSPPLAVLSGPQTDPDLCVDFHAMEPTGPEAEAAFIALRDAMTSVLTGVVLEAGDMLVVDNRVAVHGRTGFAPRYDGSDRWLRRCFAVADLRPSRVLRAPGSRVCAPVSRTGGRDDRSA